MIRLVLPRVRPGQSGGWVNKKPMNHGQHSRRRSQRFLRRKASHFCRTHLSPCTAMLDYSRRAGTAFLGAHWRKRSTLAKSLYGRTRPDCGGRRAKDAASPGRAHKAERRRFFSLSVALFHFSRRQKTCCREENFGRCMAGGTPLAGE